LLSYSQLALDESRATSVHLDDDIETAVSLLRTIVEETDAVVTHEALPNVNVERGQMVRLFQNLIGNAIKFRKPKEPPRVHVSAEQQGKEWIIRVRDNGIGFAPEHADVIFDPFRRLHGPEYPGSGIGLAACKRIVERYGGRIGAESEAGKGATFWFTVPVTE
jgi:signal transduction histidine kinase